MLERQFLDVVATLQAPSSGTEHMAPLLYALARSVRARHVLEVGMGYTTPFLAQALADNLADFRRESEQLKRKTASFLTAAAGDPVAAQQRWLEAAPALADPGYYLAPYEPCLYAFDDFSEESNHAPRVMDALAALGLDHLVRFFNGDPYGRSGEIDPRHLPLDLVWNDASRYEGFLYEYWELIDPDGGLLLLHNTVNALVGNALVAKNLKLRQISEFNDFELISLVEPHKLNQRSVTMVRRTKAFQERYLEDRREEVHQNAVRLVEAPAAVKWRPQSQRRPP